ncbi:hypothetical protein [Roseomonas indoligenes]|uniref:Uncharacterized protein n=1 Tax=Roseomonas indoligenes TaxID=2820811 RepID=A0A940S4L6_9PROT|nr:hypothetical protein [Pararoseomonas indoligenes]MBP0492100.1 hypothetical protein [Pararoseomonas indoligenes]
MFPPATVEHRRKILPDPFEEEADRIGQYGRLQRMFMIAGGYWERENAIARAQRAAAAMEQARRAAAGDFRPEAVADRGAQGPAMLARQPKVEERLVDVLDDPDAPCLERVAVVVVPDGVLDHYVRAGILSGRRLEAMQKMAWIYAHAGIAPGTGRSFGGRAHGEMTDTQARAWADFCHASDHLSQGVRPVVEDVARDRFPGGLNAVEKLRNGAAELADYWRLDPDKKP